MMTAKMGEKDSREEILKAFRLFDDDETGKITFRNLKRVAKELGENMTDEELQEMIDEADRDGDGRRRATGVFVSAAGGGGDPRRQHRLWKRRMLGDLRRATSRGTVPAGSRRRDGRDPADVDTRHFLGSSHRLGVSATGGQRPEPHRRLLVHGVDSVEFHAHDAPARPDEIQKPSNPGPRSSISSRYRGATWVQH